MATFDTLPLEILFRVLDSVSSPHDSISSSFHPLNSLAAANKHFDSAVEEYTRVLLKQHANFAPKKKSKTYINRKKWLAETCQLCYKTSKRRSTLWSVLTCCLTCDKKHFPKVTMTNAINQHKLSKLDLFTPNRLHPTLPSLSHGEYPVMGGVATSAFDQYDQTIMCADYPVIYEPDLVARGDYLHGLLGLLDHTDNSTARRRVRRHDLLMMHMEVAYSTARKIWYRKSPSLREEGKAPAVRKSMETRESRDAFVRDALASERASLHSQGASEDTAIELD